jgi:phytoene desaturase
MKFILDEIFEITGRKSEDYLDFIKLDPMYRLYFSDKTMELFSDHKKMKKEIAKKYPGQEKGLDKFFKTEKKRFEKLKPCLQIPYSSFGKMLGKSLRHALPHLALSKSVFDVIGDYFTDDQLKLAFNFQTKYLGMSAWECPGAFGIIPYVEHAFGIYHVKGGLSVISEKMADVVEEEGGKIFLKKQVKKLIVKDGAVKGVELENGKKEMSDAVIINADFGYAMTNLFPKGVIKKYTKEKLNKKKFSCSTFMLYLGVDKLYKNIEHHNIVFAKDYKQNIKDIFENKIIPKEMSFYVRNSSINDDKVAPKGHSNIYVLVPVPNKQGKISWQKNKNKIREYIINEMENRLKMKDLRKHIKEEVVLTPDDWVNEYNVHLGATFNLSHNLGQMLYFRPRNRFEEVKNCYLTGGGTHPGSGLPTIYESGRISAELIIKDLK